MKNSFHPKKFSNCGIRFVGKIIVNYVGVNNNSYFTNTLSEIHVDVNANLDYIKIQSEKKNAFHIDKTDIYQDKEVYLIITPLHSVLRYQEQI